MYQRRQMANVAVHAEDAVRDDKAHAAGGRLHGLQFRFQIRRVLVFVDDDFGLADAAAVDDAGMVQFVAENDVAGPGQAVQDAQVRHVARVEEQGRFAVLETRQVPFQGRRFRHAARREAGPRGAGTAAQGRFGRGAAHAFVKGQAQVVVARKDKEPLSRGIPRRHGVFVLQVRDAPCEAFGTHIGQFPFNPFL